MAEFLFVLGRAWPLCQAELKAVLEREKVNFKSSFTSSEIFHLSTSCFLDVNYLIQVLGGTIKIAEVVKTVEGKNKLVEEIVSAIEGSLDRKGSKIIFGLSSFGNIQPKNLSDRSKEIKEKLEEKNLKVRFVLPAAGTVLSSVVVAKQKILEIIIVNEGQKFVLAKTLTVQDFTDWGKRDFQRPAPDPHQGMLPPKVARMMVNLALANFQSRQSSGVAIFNRVFPSSNYMVLDPFCGTGTILAEGIMLGLNVTGSDQSQEAVEKTKQNLAWLREEYKVSSIKYKVFQGDAAHVSEKIPADSIAGIVTEPYLGPMLETEANIKNLDNTVLGLEKLYLGCLKDWRKVLKTDGKIVIALPSFRVGSREFFVKKPLDTCENLGYTLLAGPYQYSRPQAIVVRNIYILQKKYLS